MAEVVGRNLNGNYWYIRNPNDSNGYCWLWGEYATVTGNFAALPVFTGTRPFLHAERLAFTHPRTKERVQFTAPIPAAAIEVKVISTRATGSSGDLPAAMSFAAVSSKEATPISSTKVSAPEAIAANLSSAPGRGDVS